MELEKSDLMDLYKLSVDEIHKYHQLHQRRISFFSTLISALFAATLTAFYSSTRWYEYLLLSVGPIIIIVICKIGKRGVYGVYRLLIETITTRSKLEQLLKITTTSCNNDDDSYWADESLVPARHINDRKNQKSSDEWVKHFLDAGTKRWTDHFFEVGKILGYFLLISAFVLCANAKFKFLQ